MFVAAIVLHLLRVFFTGAYRKPRELTYWIGVTMLVLALLEGYLGYSLVDDLLSGMGLAIGNAVALSIPFVGANLGELVWGGPFPGEPAFFSRMYIAHVFLFPVADRHAARGAPRARRAQAPHAVPQRARADGAQARRRPDFSRGRRRARSGCCSPSRASWSCSAGSCRSTRSGSGGPYHTYLSTNGAQPDWYLGWLIGALRLVPGFDS